MATFREMLLAHKAFGLTAVFRHRGAAIGILAATILLATLPDARAGTYSWQVPFGDWSVSTNWSGNVVPSSTDNAYIANGGVVSCYTITVNSAQGMNFGAVQLLDGVVFATDEYLGISGTGSFTQSGGVNSLFNPYNGDGYLGTLYLGYNSGSSGIYNLSGSGVLNSYENEWVGVSGAGTFIQTGGTNTFHFGSTGVYVGYQSGSGSYSLSGSGVLQADNEYVGPVGSFNQSAGSNSAGILAISNNGRYQFSGGTLQINNYGVLTNGGVFDAMGGSGILNSSSWAMIDFSQAVPINSGSMSLSIGPYSLLLVPPGYNPATALRNFSIAPSSLVHNVGTPLTILPGQGVMCIGTISDFVNCQGTIRAGRARLNLTGGILVSGTGNVALGPGTLTVENGNSGIFGGSISTYEVYVGYSGTGVFTQSGGTTNISGYFDNGNPGLPNLGPFIVGYNAGSNGNYILTAGLLQADSEALGFRGTGTFTQSGGTNEVLDPGDLTGLVIGSNSGSRGTYNLTGSGLLSAAYEFIGDSTGGGLGSFFQSGGTNEVNLLCIGRNGSYNISGSAVVLGSKIRSYFTGPGGTLNQTGGTSSFSSGLLGCTYNLNGGLLVVQSLISSGPFNFNGGTIEASGSFSMGSMTLGTSGGGATINTAGYNATLAGMLSGPGSLTKIGTGTLGLTAANTFSGNSLISDGILALSNRLALQKSTLDTTGSGNLSFGLLTAETLGGLSGPGTLALSNSAGATVALSVGNNNADTTFSGTLNGPGSLTKIGSGSLTMAGNNTYFGSTTVSQGVLIINGAIASAVTVNSGGTLAGNGSLTNATIGPGGHLAPGDAPGLLDFSGSLTLLSGAVMDYRLDTPLDSDGILMPAGDLVLGGQQFSDFHFTPLAYFGPGDYTLITAGSITGAFGASTSGTIDGFPATLSVQFNKDLVLDVVPEPSALALLLAGGLAVLAKVRLHRSHFHPVQRNSFRMNC